MYPIVSQLAPRRRGLQETTAAAGKAQSTATGIAAKGLRETVIIYWGYIGVIFGIYRVMEKKMEATIVVAGVISSSIGSV